MVKNIKRLVPQLYIVCEDENFGKEYLELLCKERQKKNSTHRALIDHCGSNNAPETIVKMTGEKSLGLKRRGKITGSANVFCIFDVDLNTGGQTPQNRQGQIDRALILAKKYNIKIILNNSCIERWFLFHFSNSTAEWNQKEALQEIQTKFSTYSKSVNFSDKENLMKELLSPIKYKKAYHFIINTLKTLHNVSLNNSCYKIKNNPYSNMYELLSELKLI